MAARKSKAKTDVTVTVAQEGGEIAITRAGIRTTYPVVDHTVTVGEADPNLGRLQALGNDVGTAPGSNPAPEPPADKE